MDTEINVKVNYAGLIKRIAAGVLDFIIFFSPLLILIILGLLGILSDDDNSSQTDERSLSLSLSLFLEIMMIVSVMLVSTVFEILMITKFGGTPGKLLYGMRIKNTNTFNNATLIQAAIRSILKVVFLYILPSLISTFCLFLLDLGSDILDIIVTIMTTMLIFICAIFNQRKQTFYDKIAKTVVIDYKPS